MVLKMSIKLSQSTRINLFLLSLVLGLGLVYWWGQTPQQAQLTTLTSRTPDAVRTMTLDYPEGAHVALERSGPDAPWRMTAPWQMPANQSRLHALARLVEAPVLDSFPLAEGQEADFGLDRPLRLAIDGQPFAFGGTNPLNQHRYLKDGQRLVLLVDRFYHHLMGGPEALVSPLLLPPEAEIVSIQGPDFRLSKDGQDWRFEPTAQPAPVMDAAREAASGSKTRPDPEAIKHALDAWRQAQGLAMHQFQIDPEASPRRHPRWTIGLADGKSIDFEFRETKEGPWLVRGDNGLGYQLPRDAELLQAARQK